MTTVVAPGIWTLDTTASSIGFRAKLIFGLKSSGRFTRYDSTILVGESAADSSVTVTIHTDSVSTGSPMRDGHLQADKMIGAGQFPTVAFSSTAVAQTPRGLAITGDLTIRGVTRSVTLEAVSAPASGGPRYIAELVIRPKDYGITHKGVQKPLTILIDAALKPAP